MEMELNFDSIIQSMQNPNPDLPLSRPSDAHEPTNLSSSNPGQKSEIVARRIQKADREKLRRDRLNEQFIELGNALDPDRPKNDKATIVADTIQLLKDLTAQVNNLKAEYTALTEESKELMQEKNDLREEKTSLKSDIENLNVQYQQRLRAMYPWGSVDHSVVMAPPSYPYPVPVAVPPGPIPMHPSMQPYSFYANPNPGVIPNSYSTFVPYIAPTTQVESLSAQYPSPHIQLGNRSHASSNKESKNKPAGESKSGKSNDSNEVTTDLELKTPGSTGDHDSSSGQRTSKSSRKEKNSAERSSSRSSSSHSVQDSSSNSMVGSSRGVDSMAGS